MTESRNTNSGSWTRGIAGKQARYVRDGDAFVLGDATDRSSGSAPSVSLPSGAPRSASYAKQRRVKAGQPAGDSDHSALRRLYTQILAEVAEIRTLLATEPEGNRSDFRLFADEPIASNAVRVLELIEDLFEACGTRPRNLKRGIARILAQIGNADLTLQHLDLVEQSVLYLRPRFATVDVGEITEIIRSCGLDPFRGTLSEPAMRRTVTIVEVSSNEACGPGYDDPSRSPKEPKDPRGDRA